MIEGQMTVEEVIEDIERRAHAARLVALWVAAHAPPRPRVMPAEKPEPRGESGNG